MTVNWRLFAATALAVALAGCAQSQRAITPEEFYGFCWPSQVDFNCQDDALCQDYKDYLVQGPCRQGRLPQGLSHAPAEEGGTISPVATAPNPSTTPPTGAKNIA